MTGTAAMSVHAPSEGPRRGAERGRHRRGCLEIGLAATGTDRRTPGLRREEVAELAHMSVDYYTRL
ncbi:hypothetical protein GCM10010207_80600 [Streptomyces atratus]|nr:hypothetical protein GCM10010207_80600 [Streptomyces atratus]